MCVMGSIKSCIKTRGIGCEMLLLGSSIKSSLLNHSSSSTMLFPKYIDFTDLTPKSEEMSNRIVNVKL